MSNRVRGRNAFETTLNGAISSGTTSILLTTASGLVGPGYLVLEPNVPAKREYIRFESVSTNTLNGVTRGLDGSAAGAQAHDSGVKIRAVAVHQWLDLIFTDIETLEAADSAHVGGTDTADHPEATTVIRGFMSSTDKAKLDGIDAGAQADHGGLSGVTANQHHNQQHVLDGADHSGQVSNAQVPVGAVTQHQAALAITESQITDLTPHTTDHGVLDGLADDDHGQYLNVARHDADDHSSLWVTERATSSTPVAVNAVDTSIIAVTLAIPAGWGSYDVEAHCTCALLDTSGGATGVAETITAKMVHQSGDFASASLPIELMDLNYHDIHPLSMNAYVEGLTPTGNRIFTWSMIRAGVFTVSADQITLIVRAIRTS